jgi:hypothetical protein
MLGLQYPLLFDMAVPVDPAAFKKAVMHHALAKEKKGGYQDDNKHNQSNLAPARPFSCRGCFSHSCTIPLLLAKELTRRLKRHGILAVAKCF